MRLPRAWFLPETHDVLSTLTAQLDIVQTVIGVLRAWCARTGEKDTIGQWHNWPVALFAGHGTRNAAAVAHPGSVLFQYPPRRGGPF